MTTIDLALATTAVIELALVTAASVVLLFIRKGLRQRRTLVGPTVVTSFSSRPGPAYTEPMLALPITNLVHYPDSSGHACLQPKGNSVTNDGTRVNCPKCLRIARRASSKGYGSGWVAPQPPKPLKTARRGRRARVGQAIVYDAGGRGYKADITISEDS
jgi:hypothetical protein